MTFIAETLGRASPPPLPAGDVPRRVDPALPRADKLFHGISRGIGITVLVIMGSIGLFLGWQAIPTFHHYGLHFFTRSEWQPDQDLVGISSVLIGTASVALIALSVAFPLALASALYISEFAPRWIKATAISLVDLMAAVPSIIYGIWGALLLMPQAKHVARWLNANLGFLPFFKVDTDPHAAAWAQSRYTTSAFIAGLAVGMMVLPMACAVMREVFSQAPVGEKEAALALGATRWGMVRIVVLPFGRGGIIGGTMLALGRALGETIAVVLIISPLFDIKIRVLETGTITVSSLIAGRFGEASAAQLSALLTAGFVLFIITLLVNTAAAVIIGRSRSGASTEI